MANYKCSRWAGEVISKGYIPDLSNANVNQQQQQENDGEDDLLPGTRLRCRRRNLHLDPYVCNECNQYVRGGVITICGHLFCWTCLWPKLSGTATPRCPCCQRHLLMYEDIMPFHGEGPNARQEDNNVPAQPGSVPRPTGLYLSDTDFPCWFAVNDPVDGCPATFPDIRRQRDLHCAIRLIPMVYPWIGAQISFLKWFQLGCVLLIFLIWSVLSLF